MKKNKDSKEKTKQDKGLSDLNQLKDQIQQNNIQNARLGNSEVRLIGDKMILIQVVKLLAYIRYAVKNNLKTEINVKLGNRLANGEFMFDVNQSEIGDLITQNEIEIN